MRRRRFLAERQFARKSNESEILNRLLDMILHIIKKDCLLIKKSLIFLMIIPFVIPLFVFSQVGAELGSFADFVAFFMSAGLTVVMVFGSVSLAEAKYGNGNAFLCATPYKRSILVYGKYLFYLLVLIYCAVAYSFTAFLMPNVMNPLNFKVAGVVFFILFFLLSIIMPIGYKFGYEKVKYAFMIIIISPIYLSSFIISALQQRDFDPDFINNLPQLVQYIGPIVLAVMIGFISMMMSRRIFLRKEL